MKMKQVQSRYKNPDRFIEKQRGEIHLLRARVDGRNFEIERLKKENETLKTSVLGNHVFDWSHPEKVAHTTSDLSNYQTSKLQVGAVIFMKGEVVKLTTAKDRKESSVTMNFKSVYAK